MKCMAKRALCLAAALAVAGSMAGCGAQSSSSTAEVQQSSSTATPTETTTETTAKAPKYVFLFIGDGMSYPQIQSTADYLGALTDTDYHMAAPSLDDNAGAILDGPSYWSSLS